MANLKEKAEWAEGIYQIEMTDPVVGVKTALTILRTSNSRSARFF